MPLGSDLDAWEQAVAQEEEEEELPIFEEDEEEEEKEARDEDDAPEPGRGPIGTFGAPLRIEAYCRQCHEKRMCLPVKRGEDFWPELNALLCRRCTTRLKGERVRHFAKLALERAGQDQDTYILTDEDRRELERIQGLAARECRREIEEAYENLPQRLSYVAAAELLYRCENQAGSDSSEPRRPHRSRSRTRSPRYEVDFRQAG